MPLFKMLGSPAASPDEECAPAAPPEDSLASGPPPPPEPPRPETEDAERWWDAVAAVGAEEGTVPPEASAIFSVETMWA